MRRVVTEPRLGWQRIVEGYGFEHHSLSSEEEPVDYWNEAAYYELTADEVNLVEYATNQLEQMCLHLVDVVVDENLFDRLHISPVAADLVRQSWERFDRSLYGRFDLSLGADGSLKMLEYNADTPTSLFEAAVAQWRWLQDRFPERDQFNSIHERLIEAWKAEGRLIHFGSLEDSESVVTTAYLEDTATQAGLETCFITMADIGYDGSRFVDLQGREVATLFKLYPWEWLLTDEFGEKIPACATRFDEPAWKMGLSNKAMLPLLHELVPRNKYLLETSNTEPHGVSAYVRKPVLGREGSNVRIVRGADGPGDGRGLRLGVRLPGVPRHRDVRDRLGPGDANHRELGRERASCGSRHPRGPRDHNEHRTVRPARHRMTPLLLVFAIGACYAIDGDTLRCGDERVRLARINSVERGEPGFQETKDGIRIMIEGKEVRCVVRKREKYGRLLGECSTDDTPSLSDAMLASGLAEKYWGRP